MNRETEGKTLFYISIYNQLKADIISGIYPQGTLLPPESDLIKRFSASRTTIRHAINLLKADNLVTVRQGYGTEVSDTSLIYTSLPGPTKFKNMVSLQANTLCKGEYKTQNGVVDITTADKCIADKLHITIGEKVYRVQRIKLIDDQPLGYIVSYLPYSLVPGLEKFSGTIQTLYECLKTNYSIVTASAEEHVSVCVSKFLESRLLNIPINSPLLFLYRISRSSEQDIIEYTESYYTPDKYELLISMVGEMDYSSR